MTDALWVDLEDGELLEEIRLTAALMLMASETTGPVTQEAVDEVLAGGS
jgi:hypothetical protein